MSESQSIVSQEFHKWYGIVASSSFVASSSSAVKRVFPSNPIFLSSLPDFQTDSFPALPPVSPLLFDLVSGHPPPWRLFNNRYCGNCGDLTEKLAERPIAWNRVDVDLIGPLTIKTPSGKKQLLALTMMTPQPGGLRLSLRLKM
jgi:hypothetical protein